jgi:hypothetical protein
LADLNKQPNANSVCRILIFQEHPWVRSIIVKDEIKKSVMQRDAKIGCVLFGVMTILFLLNNRFVFPLLDRFGGGPPQNFQEYLVFAMLGVVLGQAALLSIWTVLSPQTLLTRFSWLVCAIVPLAAAWMLGYMTFFDPDVGLNFRNREELYYAGYFPCLFLALSLPIIALRFFGWRVLGSQYDDSTPKRKPLSIVGFMVTTSIVCGALAFAQVPVLTGITAARNWEGVGVTSGFMFAVGLFIVFPAVLLLFSRRFNFGLWAPVLLVLQLSAVALPFFVFQLQRRTFQIGQVMLPVVIIGTGIIVLVLGILVIRFFGFRLVKAERSTKSVV